jgi:hypothetical protein
MPIALPPGVIGSWAAFRKGTLATARLVLAGPDGGALATATVAIDWNDVRWTTGGPKLKRQRRPEAVLIDAVERAIQLAIRELTRSVERSATSLSSAADPHPGIWHRHFMAGRILESTAGGVYLCIGSADGAIAGQRLEVVRTVRGHTGPKQVGPSTRRQEVGEVRIDQVVDGHFARATVISGRPRKGDVVRLAKPAAPAAEGSAATLTPASTEVTR